MVTATQPLIEREISPRRFSPAPLRLVTPVREVEPRTTQRRTVKPIERFYASALRLERRVGQVDRATASTSSPEANAGKPVKPGKALANFYAMALRTARG